jgi:hypothetical protein
LTAGLFGEAAINLTAAGVFPPGTCEGFGSVFIKSRSSSAFGAEVKDFIAPQPINISNCGRIIVKKRTDPRGVNQNFTFTSTISGAQLSCVTDTTPAGFTLNDNGNTNSDSAGNTENCGNVPAGNYPVTEGAEPASFVLESLTCSTVGAGGSTGTQDGTTPEKANITLAPGDTVTCVYVDQQQLGAIKITKTSSKAAATALAGAKFSISSGGNPIAGSPFTTDANGQICQDHLPFGTYSVQETQAPAGYKIDDTTAHNVSVNATSTCGDGNETTFAATDTPLTDLTVHVASEASGGTQSKVTCVDSGNNNIGNSPQPASGFADPVTLTADPTHGAALTPGTYTCTIVVDP